MPTVNITDGLTWTRNPIGIQSVTRGTATCKGSISIGAELITVVFPLWTLINVCREKVIQEQNETNWWRMQISASQSIWQRYCPLDAQPRLIPINWLGNLISASAKANHIPPPLNGQQGKKCNNATHYSTIHIWFYEVFWGKQCGTYNSKHKR